MATFMQQFDKAVDWVRKVEARRVSLLKRSGYATYRDMKAIESEGNDSTTLRNAEMDCSELESAFAQVARLASGMGKAMGREADELDKAAQKASLNESP